MFGSRAIDELVAIFGDPDIATRQRGGTNRIVPAVKGGGKPCPRHNCSR